MRSTTPDGHAAAGFPGYAGSVPADHCQFTGHGRDMVATIVTTPEINRTFIKLETIL